MTIAGSSGSGCQDRCCGSNKGHPANMPDPETLAKMQKQYQMQLQMAGRMNQNHLQKSAVTPSSSVFIPVEEDDLD
ncbi:Oidioi.mRNA.OKI2018_I69.XSR.g15522.t1.cds [Oikopleura dioica]|uniref:Oidioi.mRNA.OKI2018_I69.XSR.g15522.t1.cds n=1 Tax=Oikopleura dioica TaxID=34765 RepID=A0ABN7SD43_OIKDI|nr:Oidioi.mRNA.OKI2018_I69.XSR.g15522.t1.cds [Oikopleura dioica]